MAVAIAGCGDDGDGPIDETPVTPLAHASKSSTIALSDDRARVAMVNPDDGTLSVFQTADHARTAKVATGGAPSSVVFAADSTTVYVANRSDGTVVRIVGADGGTPAIDATTDVGAEPVALALSPSGKKLFVAELAESRVTVIETATMEVLESFDVDRPRALAITNNLDTNDDDETLIVTQYFGVTVGGEAKDTGKVGRVRLYSLADLTTHRTLELAPIDSGFARGGVATNPTVQAFPNLLSAAAIAGSRVFITGTAASPEGPARFDNNVFPVVHVGDLATATEVTDAGGTINLARAIYDASPTPSPDKPRFIPGMLADLSFVDDSTIGYVVGLAGDVMIRVTFDADRVSVGSSQNKQIDLAGNDTIGRCQNPTGVVVDSVNQRAYVNCWVSRRLGVVALDSQSLLGTFEASPPPANEIERSVQRGKRFYFTGRGRWSAAVSNGAAGGEGWSACGSCHPDGLTDNVTWVFATGPRQTTSQDGSFSHGPGPQKQRVFNWTGIFDEHHDFERNTRDVSGGLGVITSAPTQAECNQLDKETPVTLPGGLAQPLKELQDAALCGHKDWDDIDNYVKTIAPTQARKAIAAEQVARGRELFVQGNCARCHGGAGWTVSRRFFVPASATNSKLATTPFTAPAFFPQTWMYKQDASTERTLVSGQPIVPLADDTGPAEPAAVGVAQVACATRNVGTFGVPGDTAATNALELRPGSPAFTRAQGRTGYNVPSLYGLALGAPYLHHGQAATLKDLFTDSRWSFHTTAGNANMSVLLQGAGKLDDLIAFLHSIDAATEEIAVPRDPGSALSFDACPETFQ